MSLDQPQSNKMMTAAPAKKEFHFSGDGIYHNLSIIAENIEDATKQWLQKRQFIDIPGGDVLHAEQSTPAPKAESESEVQ